MLLSLVVVLIDGRRAVCGRTRWWSNSEPNEVEAEKGPTHRDGGAGAASTDADVDMRGSGNGSR